MPNHVSHRIVCTGTSEDVAALKQLMVVKSEESYSPDGKSFDFNQLIPIPPILKRTRPEFTNSTLGPNGRAMLLAGDPDTLVWSGPRVEATEAEQAEIDKVGTSDWYAWSIVNWGTKWNAYHYREESDEARYEFVFDTAWSPPEPVLDKLVEKFPNLTFNIDWFDEGWMHAGSGVIGAANPDAVVDDLGCKPNDQVHKRVYGYYPDPEYTIWDVPEETQHRIAYNFHCEDVLEASDQDGYYPITAVMDSDDPEVSDDELFMIRSTQNYVRDKIAL